MTNKTYRSTSVLVLCSGIIAYLSLHYNSNHSLMTSLIPYLLLIGNISILLIKRNAYSAIMKYVLLLLAIYFTGFNSNFSETYLYVSISIAIFSIDLTPIDKYSYITVSILGFLFSSVVKLLPDSNFANFIDNLYTDLIPFFTFLLIIIIIKIRKKGKLTEAQLNLELKKQNKKLQEYASQIEELTLLDERNRVAQELHDSLGHYLMAISMHLDILEKVKGSPDKSKQIFDKTKSLVKDSIKELRVTVYKLKEMRKSNILSDSINDLVSNLSTLGEISFKTDIDKEIETSSPFIKDIIYKTVKESITNGMKHGKAKNFNISIKVSDKIIFTIENDGLAATDITKSNGLKGIEERLALARGTAKFDGIDGFKVTCTIPKTDAI